ncbi:p-hydroxybenzoic acid efflux pump operon protein AaeX [Pectobacteriaceae bacterium CE70]|uniref:Protein AaeX n=1 Tax=Serratia sp. (strain ATCC 39006) TaxID=104623 RepID=A0A2I5T1R4_SERS3|nr:MULTISPECIES: p-hydroxybenzoic acid efflux pump operon protein AaeX [Enterobacterales]AUG98484.1 transporter [Serratia sp. ATCC 39006]AUH02799.1 transporter [Serratia sp. ATCC 39006]WJV67220.1 p-hydroxybenzoic acid efflux pump operon protein AaeX [Pectobacteriaceae bacterium CE70]
MGSLPVMVLFGLSFPPVFFVLLVSLALFFASIRLLQPTGIYDVVWHPALFNTALFCCLFYLLCRFGL